MNRRSGGIFLVPLLGIVVFVLISFREAPWGQWAWAVDLMTGSTVLTGPVVAACAAHLGWTQAQMDDLVDSTPRASVVPFRCAGLAWGWGAIGYVVGAGAIIVGVLFREHGGPFPLWAALIGFPVLGVAALLGALAVRLLPYRVTVLAIGPAVFLFGAFGPHPYGDLMKHGPTTGSLAGLEIDRVFWVLQFGALLAMASLVAGVMVGAARRSFAVRPLTVPAVIVAGSLAALVILGSVLGDPGRLRLVPSDERPTACQGSAPSICVAPSNRFALKATAAAMRSAGEHLREVGVELPERYEESLPGYRPPVWVGGASTDFDFATLRVGARSIATPASCPQWHDPDVAPEKALQARALIADWIRVRAGHQVVSWSVKGQAWLATSGTPEAIAWVRTTFAQLRGCTFAKILMPWSVEPQ